MSRLTWFNGDARDYGKTRPNQDAPPEDTPEWKNVETALWDIVNATYKPDDLIGRFAGLNDRAADDLPQIVRFCTGPAGGAEGAESAHGAGHGQVIDARSVHQPPRLQPARGGALWRPPAPGTRTAVPHYHPPGRFLVLANERLKRNGAGPNCRNSACCN